MNDESEPSVSLHERLRRHVPHVRVTQTLIAVNVLVFLASVYSGAGLGMTPGEVPLAWGANFGPATQDGEWWRLGSAMFLHFGVVHLAMNMWALWDGGQLVERMFGPLRFLILYVLAGISGNLLSLVSHGSGPSVSGGASGAIFGIYGALLIYLWQERRHLHPQEFRWLFWGAAVFSVLIIVFGVVVPGVDNAAHIGGFVCGLMAAMVFVPNRKQRASRNAGAAALVLSVWWAVLVSQIPQAPYRWSDEASARREIDDFLKNEVSIAKAWQDIVDESRRGDASFGELAGRIDSDITNSYERSFEHLSQMPITPGLPSGPRLGMLRDYAALRRDASRLLAEGLRDGDAVKVRKAMALQNSLGGQTKQDGQ